MKKSLLILPIIFLSFMAIENDFITKWKNDVAFKPASIGFAFYDLDSSKYIVDYNKEKVLSAASTQKLLTTAIALKNLGADYQFTSTIAYSGRIQEKTLRGDICIYPNKNPCLANKRFGNKVEDIVNEIDNFLKNNHFLQKTIIKYL